MGNCIPSNLDPEILVKSPQHIRRISKSSSQTHETWTLGDDDDDDTISFCSSLPNKTNMNMLKSNFSSMSLSEIPTNLYEFIFSKHCNNLNNSDKESNTEKYLNKHFNTNLNDKLSKTKSNYEINKIIQVKKNCNNCLYEKEHSSRICKNFHSTSIPKLINVNYSVNSQNNYICDNPDELNKNSNYVIKTSPEDSGVGSCSAFNIKDHIIMKNQDEHNLNNFEINTINNLDKLKSYNILSNSNQTLSSKFNDSADNNNCNINSNVPKFELTFRPPIPPKFILQNSVDRRIRHHKCNEIKSSISNKHQKEVVTPAYEEWFPDLCRQISCSNIKDSPVNEEKSNSFDKIRTQPIIATACSSYIKINPNELSITVGERFLVLNQYINEQNENIGSKDSGLNSGGLWFVQSLEPQFLINDQSVKGYVPAKYLKIVGYSPKSHKSWLTVDRKEAERLLSKPGSSSATYILRPSSDSSNTFALSLRYFDEKINLWSIKHYRVRYRSMDGIFYIFRRQTFSTIDQLLAYYTKHNDGLACTLNKPYPRIYETLSNLNHLEVDRYSFVFIKCLGRGSFGEVWQAVWNDHTPVAIKTLLGNGNMETARFLEEARLMQRLNNPRIVRLLGVCTKPSSEPIQIVTELMERGSLKNYMLTLEPSEVKFQRLIDMMINVAEGMVYLENQNYVHRDLRASNVLVDDRHELKVADFGLAHMLSDSDEYIGTMKTKFPVRWTAPEGIIRQTYSNKSDVWSFGILIYEILTFCELPYKEFSSYEVKEQVCSGYRLNRPKLKISVNNLSDNLDGYEVPKTNILNSYMCPNNLYFKMLECWDYEPDKRPTFNELYKYLLNYTIE